MSAVTCLGIDGAKVRTTTWRYRHALHTSVIVEATFQLVPDARMRETPPSSSAAAAPMAGHAPYRPLADVTLCATERGAREVHLAVRRGDHTLLDRRIFVPDAPITERDDVGFGMLDLPTDVDWRQFQAAPAEQRTAHLAGDEWLLIEDAHMGRPLRSQLPNTRARAFIAELGADGWSEVSLVCDMLAVNVDRLTCTLAWRGHVRVEDAAALERLRAVGIVHGGQQMPELPTPASIQRAGTSVAPNGEASGASHGGGTRGRRLTLDVGAMTVPGLPVGDRAASPRRACLGMTMVSDNRGPKPTMSPFKMQRPGAAKPARGVPGAPWSDEVAATVPADPTNSTWPLRGTRTTTESVAPPADEASATPSVVTELAPPSHTMPAVNAERVRTVETMPAAGSAGAGAAGAESVASPEGPARTVPSTNPPPSTDSTPPVREASVRAPSENALPEHALPDNALPSAGTSHLADAAPSEDAPRRPMRKSQAFGKGRAWAVGPKGIDMTPADARPAAPARAEVADCVSKVYRRFR